MVPAGPLAGEADFCVQRPRPWRLPSPSLSSKPRAPWAPGPQQISAEQTPPGWLSGHSFSFLYGTVVVTSCKLAERGSQRHTPRVPGSWVPSDSEQKLLQGRARLRSALEPRRARDLLRSSGGSTRVPRTRPSASAPGPLPVGPSTPVQPINPEEAGSVSA